MKFIHRALPLLLAPLYASAAITLTYHAGFDNLPITLIDQEIELENVAGAPDYPTASIRNIFHHDFYNECYGLSEIGFMRHRITEADCLYFFRASDIDANAPATGSYFAIENHARVYWMVGDGNLVDGATWGSDNYILMRDLSNDTIIAVLQFDFDQTTGAATLLASAIDLNGLTYSQGVRAITGAPIPEPASFATLAGFGVLALGATRRRGRA